MQKVLNNLCSINSQASRCFLLRLCAYFAHVVSDTSRATTPIASTTASKLTGQFLAINTTGDAACDSTRTDPSCDDCIFVCLCARGAHDYNDKRYVPSGSTRNH